MPRTPSGRVRVLCQHQVDDVSVMIVVAPGDEDLLSVEA